MFLIEPPRTSFDLNFVIARVSVRVHPFFWLLSLILGAGGMSSEKPPAEVLLWVAVSFVSILIHELGHSLAFRWYGWDSRIVLYSFGGLAIRQDQFGEYRPDQAEREGLKHVAISFAGPAAGFLLAALVMAAIRLAGHKVWFEWSLWPVQFEYFKGRNLNVLLNDLLFINIMWGVINLFPVFPLDGGQIARELLVMRDAREGTSQSLMLSIVTAVGLGVFAAIKLDDYFMAIFFAILAFMSYTNLAALRQGGYDEGDGGRGW